MDALSSRFLSNRCAVILSRTSRLTGSALRLLSPGAMAKTNVQKPEPQQTTTRCQLMSRGVIPLRSLNTFQAKHCLTLCDVIVKISISVVKTIGSMETSSHVSSACELLFLLSEVSGQCIFFT